MKKKPSMTQIISWQEAREESYKKNGEKRNQHYNKELFDLGTQWSLSGKLLEEARPEVQIEQNFINGYNRGERLKKISELQPSPKTR